MSNGSLAFVFPGQGSQYVGMGKDLCDQFSVAQQVFSEAEEALGLGEHPECLVPGRTLYHISEVRHYFYLCGRFHLLSRNPDAARSCLKVLRDLESDSPAALHLAKLCDHPERSLLACLAKARRRVAEA